MDALILLGSFFLLMIIGTPVAYALGIAALIGAWWIDIPLDAVMIAISSGVNKFSLLAIPFFVLAGAIMAEGGMARRLVAFANVLVGFIRGGLSLVNILASTFFGAISGSSMADTASVGSVLIPEMEKKGYPRDFATAVTVSGSVQAILIPPSHNAVIYSLAAGGTVSIAALFIAGVLPGLLLGLTLAIMCLFMARKRNYPKGEVIPLRQALKVCADEQRIATLCLEPARKFSGSRRLAGTLQTSHQNDSWRLRRQINVCYAITHGGGQLTVDHPDQRLTEDITEYVRLMIALTLVRSMSAPATPSICPWRCTGVATVITSLPEDAAMYGSVTMVCCAPLAALYQPRARGS